MTTQQCSTNAHMRHHRRLSLGLLAAINLFINIAQASCPTTQPPVCPIDDQMASGRWDLSQIQGTYELNGSEVFCQFGPDPCDLPDDYSPVSGQLTVEKMGGIDENYIEVACDGSVTGYGHEVIQGTIEKTPNIQYGIVICSSTDPWVVDGPADMMWDVEIEREYTISGMVTAAGTMDLNYTIQSATVDFNQSVFAFGEDCFWYEVPYDDQDIDITGSNELERVTLSGVYDSTNGSWTPTQTPRPGHKTWLDDILHRFEIGGQFEYANGMSLTPLVRPPGFTQPTNQLYNTFFIQDGVTVTDDVEYNSEPETPLITNMTLVEPAQYIPDISIDTDVIVTIDWRGQVPDQVEFTYSGTTETVPGQDTVVWTFDAGEAGDTIEAVAIQGDSRSLTYTLAVPKVSLPAWAGSVGDWNGQSGITYDATLDWPISLEATETISSLALFNGQWGISGSVSSDYEVQTFSSGTAGAGSLDANADFSAAGKNFSLQMQGSNTTTLTCDSLTTTGDGSVTVPIPGWQKTLNPLTAIPGLESGVCALSGFLCSVLNSVGIKASASASVSGSGTYEGQSGPITWTGGSIGGDISAGVGASISLPPPISSLASVSVNGTGSGCLEITVAPSPAMSTLGGSLELTGMASFFGLSTSATETWPFGDACGGAPVPRTRGASNAFVPVDGQLAMAHLATGSDLTGIAVWSELPVGQARPSGDIQYRFYDQSSDTWGSTLAITSDSDADGAPTVAYEPGGQILIVYQRSEGTVPAEPSALPAFANNFELHWALIDPQTELIVDSGQLTDNAVNDFGPRLITDAAGAISLFWQRANGIEITGTLADPVEILHMHWDATLGTWTPETTVASNLSYTYGWSAAAYSPEEQVVGIILDMDQDYQTAEDRELHRIQMTGGSWGIAGAAHGPTA